jgi:hypothetical protein
MQQSEVRAVDDIRAVFQDVLEGSDFRRHGASPIIGWLQALAEAIERFLSRWIPVLGETEARILSWLLIAATVAAVVLMVLRSFADRGAPRAGREMPARPAPARPRDASEWLAWAREAARTGRLREAATGVYQATILRLDARGTLSYRAWKTPGDYALEVSGDEPLRVPFLDFLGRFLELAFGAAEPSAKRFEAFSAGASRLGGPA